MKSQLRLGQHVILPERAATVEVWYGGELIGTIYGADGPGIRFITKHKVITEDRSDEQSALPTSIARVTILDVQVHR